MKDPYLIVDEPTVKTRVEKLTFPNSNPNTGIIMSVTKDETIFPNAAPMITPTARSKALPLTANSLNSLNIFKLLSNSDFRIPARHASLVEAGGSIETLTAPGGIPPTIIIESQWRENIGILIIESKF